MVVDRRFVARILSEIEDHVSLVEQVKAEGQDSFLSDRVRRYGAQYALQAAVEGVIAIAHHLIAECNLETPERNLDSVGILVREGIVVNPGLGDSLPRMVRFRNLLVHRYWQVDPEAVWTIMIENLSDLRDFCADIQAFLARNPTL